MKKQALLLSILVMTFISTSVYAEDFDHNQWDKRIVLSGGALFYNMSGDFSSNKDDHPKYTVDMDDLGLEDNYITVFLSGAFRLGERWRLQLDYFGYHEDSTKKSDLQFDYDDVFIPVGATVDSNLDIDVYVANLGYDIYQSNNSRITLGLGAHVADLSMEISGEAQSAGGIPVNLGEGDEDILAPLPNIYLSGAYAINENLIVKCSGGWMSMSYGDYDGDLLFARGFLEYWPFKNVGFGAGYAYTKADIDYDPGYKKETYDIKMPGPVVYLAVGF